MGHSTVTLTQLLVTAVGEIMAKKGDWHRNTHFTKPQSPVHYSQIIISGSYADFS